MNGGAAAGSGTTLVPAILSFVWASLLPLGDLPDPENLNAYWVFSARAANVLMMSVVAEARLPLCRPSPNRRACPDARVPAW